MKISSNKSEFYQNIQLRPFKFQLKSAHNLLLYTIMSKDSYSLWDKKLFISSPKLPYNVCYSNCSTFTKVHINCGIVKTKT